MSKNKFITAKFVVLFILFLSISNSINAQSSSVLETVKKLNENKDYKKAIKLIEPHYNQNKNDLYSLWLYGQTLHFLKRYNNSQQVYKTAIELYPNNKFLILDYANKLAELGKFNKAIKILNGFTKNKSNELFLAANKSLSKIYFWQGNYSKALESVNIAIKSDRQNKEMLTLRDAVLLAKSKWIKAYFDVLSDDQPLQSFTPKLEFGTYINSFLTIGISAESSTYKYDNISLSSQKAEAKAKISFHKMKMYLDFSCGFMKLPNNESSWIGKVDLKKAIYRHLSLGAKIEKSPYLYTTAGINSKLIQDAYEFSLNWNDPHGWTGKAAINANRFTSEKNCFRTLSAWVVTPALKVSDFNFKLGYGFNYSTSKENNFTAIDSLAYIQENWDSSYVIEGKYTPFFTPIDQTIHSLVGIITYSPNKKMEFGINANLGIFAKTNTPYLFLNNNENDNIFIDRKFNEDKYFPMEIKSYASFKLSNKISLNAYHIYLRTNFYVQNHINLSTKVIF